VRFSLRKAVYSNNIDKHIKAQRWIIVQVFNRLTNAVPRHHSAEQASVFSISMTCAAPRESLPA